MLPVDILWICAMAGPRKAAIERASSMLAHWERKLEFYNLHMALRLPVDTERCAKWTSFLTRLEAKVYALRMRRDVLVSLEQAATLDRLPIEVGEAEQASAAAVAERFEAIVAETERRLRLA
jgi:hypothetical protein